MLVTDKSYAFEQRVRAKANLHHNDACLLRQATYIEGFTIELKVLGREQVLATVVDGTSTPKVLVTVGRDELLKDFAVYRGRHIGGDGDIIMVNCDVGKGADLKEIGKNSDRLSGLAFSGAPHELCEL